MPEDIFSRPFNKDKVIEALRKVIIGEVEVLDRKEECTHSLPKCPVVDGECAKCGWKEDNS